jgi:hypothetical protein|tara:strand:- start:1271 stop:1729 length:459 start_codon:yes stop_codon:yes gene_type:complete
MKKLLTALSVISICSSAVASEMTFKFGSPSFSGNGKSSHYLTIENIEKTRKDALKAQAKADADKLISDAKNTPIAKFKANIESRFYTALAKQITDNVFGADGLQQDSGTFTNPVGGETVAWTTPADTGNVVVTVTEADGTVTTFTMPKEDNS